MVVIVSAASIECLKLSTASFDDRGYRRVVITTYISLCRRLRKRRRQSTLLEIRAQPLLLSNTLLSLLLLYSRRHPNQAKSWTPSCPNRLARL